MKKAQIQDGQVVNIIEVDPENMPDWCANLPDGEHVGIGWIVSGDTLVPPPEAEMTIAEATEQIVLSIDHATVVITGPVPEVERLSWTAKEQDARAYTQGRGASDLLLIESTETGETLDDLAARIIRNADRYRAVVAAMTGIRRAAIADMNDGQSPGAVYQRVQSALAALIKPQ